MEGMSWIADLSDMLGGLLEIAVYAGAYAGLLAVVVFAINVLFRRWLTAGQMGLLWTLVMLRLIVPIAPGTSFSLENLVKLGVPRAAEAPVVTQPMLPFLAPVSHVPENVRKLTEVKLSNVAPAAVDESNWFDTMMSAIPLVWFAGGLAGFVYTLANYTLFCGNVNRDSEHGDPRVAKLWAECCEIAGVRRMCSIRQFNGVSQPAIMGVLRPTLLLPVSAIKLDDEQLRMVMLHELAHVRRWDIAANWALVAIRVVQWWNPVYWLAAARIRSLREQTCDAFAIRRMESQAGQRYGSLLLALAEHRPTGGTWRVMLPASILSFFPSLFRRRVVRARLKALRSATMERGRWQSAGIATLLVVLAVCGFTVAREEEEIDKPMDLQTWMASHPEEVLATPSYLAANKTYAGPQETREYDVTNVLKAVQKEVESNSVGEKSEGRLDPPQLLETTLRQMYGVDSSIPTSQKNERAGDPKEVVKAVNESSPPIFKVTGTTLSVTAPTGLHDTLRRMLDAWGENGLEQIAIETRFLDSKRDLVSELGVSWQFVEGFSSERDRAFPAAGRDGEPAVRAEASVDEYLPLVVSTLNEEQTKKLINLAQADRRTNVLSAPKITIYNGEEATLAIGCQRPFVVGMFQRTPGVTEPKIVEFDEGTKIKLRAVVGHDHKKVHVEAAVDLRWLGDVATASTLYRGSSVSIQVPSVKRRSIDVTADVERGQTLLVGCIPTGKEQPYSYYLLSARTISELTAAPK